MSKLFDEKLSNFTQWMSTKMMTFSHSSSSNSNGSDVLGLSQAHFAIGYIGLCVHDAANDGGFVRRFDWWFFVVYNALWVSLHVGIVLAAKFGWFYDSWENVRELDATDRTQTAHSNM